jgi:hypothetical protein
MKKSLFLILALIVSGSAYAQIAKEELSEREVFNNLEMENMIISNQVFIEQSGTENDLISIQQNSDLSSNQVLSSQIGVNNTGYIFQTGSWHQTVLRQNGQNNEANLWQTGNLINQEIQQNGNENTINSYMKNASIFEKTAVLMQNGNNNRIDFAIFGDETPTASQLIKITQQGDGFVAKALMESSNFPIEITQKAGPGGGSMNVDVSVSYFSFPMK